MIGRFLGAIQFLTVVPVRYSAASSGASAISFPLVGALLGAVTGAILLLCSRIFSASVAALIALIFLVAVTGCLHEDALADVADAFRIGRSRERIMLVLKDSRIGSYGGVALALSLMLRWQSLAAMRQNPVLGLAAALALSRAALVALGATAPAAGEGLGRAFVEQLSRPAMYGAVAQAVALAFLAGWRNGAVMIIASAIIVILAHAWFVARLGGVNGDCLGATCQIVEMMNLLILVWRP